MRGFSQKVQFKVDDRDIIHNTAHSLKKEPLKKMVAHEWALLAKKRLQQGKK